MEQVIYGLGGYDENKPNNNNLKVENFLNEVFVVDSVKEAAIEKLRAFGLTESEIQSMIGY